MYKGSGFRFRISGLGYRVQALRFRTYDGGLRV